jgi:hypothetical protein
LEGLQFPVAKAGQLSEADVAALTGLRRLRHQRFVAAYVATNGMLAEASTAAGYHVRAAWRLMQRPDIIESIRVVREEAARRAAYGLDRLIGDLDDAAAFAIQTENATALVRARELKGKALGLLVDRIDARVQQIPFRIEINTALPVLPAVVVEGGE